MNDFLMPLEERKNREWLHVAQLVVVVVALFLLGYFGAQALTDGLP